MITRTISEMMTITSNTRIAAATVNSDLKAVGERNSYGFCSLLGDGLILYFKYNRKYPIYFIFLK